MPISDLLLALLVITTWGLNFLFVKLGLTEMPPLLLCASRFIVASIPGIFFIKRPAPFNVVVTYGLFMFALQFTLLFMGINAGISPGIASLITQTQVFFSIFFAFIFLKEKPNSWQITGALISFTGIGLVAIHADKTLSLPGLLLLLAASGVWGMGNLITKKVRTINTLSLVVWGSFIASFPMILLSILLYGPHQIVSHLQHLTIIGGLSTLYIAYLSTWVGYSSWNWLLRKYPVSTVAPFTLLIPLVAIFSSILFFKEPFEAWKWIAGILVIGGLCINLLGSRFFAYRQRPKLETNCLAQSPTTTK